MPESPEERDAATLARIEAKVDAVAAMLGGRPLKDRYEEIERDRPARQRTFRRAGCGCWKGSLHAESCPKHKGNDPRVRGALA